LAAPDEHRRRYDFGMKHVQTSRHRKLFAPLIESRTIQSAMMALKPRGSSSDEPENEHAGAQQWLFVVSGSGRAIVSGRTVKLRDGSLLLIERGEMHQITNTGRGELVTINFYAPPAYDADGEVKSAVKRQRRR
jgi:mannose-6-phosphate isomerase-like protein (cupin superfamily)